MEAMGITTRAFWLAGWLALAIAACCSAGEDRDAAAKAALETRITLKAAQKTFEEAVRAACTAAGVEPEFEAAPAATANGKGSVRSGYVGGVLTNAISCAWENEKRVYGLEIATPVSLQSVLKVLCEKQRVQYFISGGKIVIGPNLKAAFDPDAVAPSQRPGAKHAAEKEWRRAVQTIVVEQGAWEAACLEGKEFNLGDRVPLDVYLDASLAALKGHADKDAVRLWFLCAAVEGLWCKFGVRSENQRELAQVRGALREALELQSPEFSGKGLAELAALLRGLYKERAKIHAHEAVGNVRDEYFLNEALSGAYITAALATPDRQEAIAWARAGAWLHFTNHGCSHLFDPYYRAVSGYYGYPAQLTGNGVKHAGAWVQAVEADLAEIEKLNSEASRRALPRFHYRLALALVAAGRPKDAVAHFETALEKDPDAGEYSDNPRPLMQSRSSAAGFKPVRRDGWLNLADAQHAAGETGKAIVLLAQRIKGDPTNLAYVKRLGFLYEASGEKPKAIQAYRQAQELDSKDPGARLGLERLEGRASTALPVTPAPAKPQDLQDRLTEISMALMQARMAATQERMQRPTLREEVNPVALPGARAAAQGYAAALGKTQQALQAYPLEMELLEREIECLYLQGRTEEAGAALQRLGATRPEVAARITEARTLERIQELSQEKKFDAALALLRPLSAKDPAKPAYRSQEIRLLVDAGRYEEALKIFTEHEAQFTPESQRLVLKVEVLWALGRTREAEEALERFEALGSGGLSKRFAEFWRKKLKTSPGKAGATSGAPPPLQSAPRDEDF